MKYKGKYLFTIGPEHLPYPPASTLRERSLAKQALGTFRGSDLGKQVFMRDGVIEVENDEQRARRLQDEVH